MVFSIWYEIFHIIPKLIFIKFGIGIHTTSVENLISVHILPLQFLPNIKLKFRSRVSF